MAAAAAGRFDALTLQGDVLAQEGRHAEAAAVYREALAEGPATVPLLLALSSAHFECNRLDEAEAYARVAGDLLPNAPQPHVHRGVIALLQGRAEPGWAGLAWRRGLVPSPMQPAPPVPEWDGGPLEGLHLLLLREQGFGDVLQFVRYGPRLQALGATVHLDVQPPLRRLLADQGLGQVLFHGTATPIQRFCHLMDLPRLLGVPPQGEGPGAPYLRLPRIAGSARPGRAGRLQVGLAWAGNPGHARDRKRSLAPALVRSLLARDDCDFHSLLAGPAAARAAAELDAGPRFGERAAGVRDFLDLARLVDAMDLVISVDTAVAHLAGAMGRETWLLLGTPPDWRWGLQGDRTAWYGSMRLFRQPVPGDWQTPLAAVTAALAERAAVRR